MIDFYDERLMDALDKAVENGELTEEEALMEYRGFYNCKGRQEEDEDAAQEN